MRLQTTSPKPQTKPISTKTLQCPKLLPPLVIPTLEDNTYNNIIHEMHPMDPIIDLDTCLQSINHDLEIFIGLGR
jgi:hypothetical protein